MFNVLLALVLVLVMCLENVCLVSKVIPSMVGSLVCCMGALLMCSEMLVLCSAGSGVKSVTVVLVGLICS